MNPDFAPNEIVQMRVEISGSKKEFLRVNVRG
jgi:hypothetical protein